MSIAYTITTSEPVNQQIYRYLRKDIVTCVIQPGSLLSEKEVSARFNVSRQPVREAFIKLAEAGLVQVLPQRGTFVRKISARRVADGRFIREAVEVSVVRRAALEIEPAALMTLEHNLQLQKMAASRQDSQAFLGLDDEFHRLIAESINCALAWETVENIKAAMDRVRFLTLSEVSPPDSLIEQHEEILSALKNHDADAAEAAMRRHLQEMIFSITPIAERNSEWFESL
ncbi:MULTISPECIES: GntR family transcriptional regulator [Pantoea]|jgi:DNA-binding GntR family transcriptional regulator|uniref:GntR family transcriptional regulator n=3 Tax=Pantoea TaxID=53335 RepID=A0AAJ5QLC7_9GAMM|nr:MULTISPECIES: GntR family transcriptional regulator [Pantoea]MDU6434117.1 GntR family transcriptional regulator [Pantoea sp.]MBZ6384998.1 GntR family transcriptional regulator [Pantoea piersonii]MBZ6398878.1 GntR family transcriptional regulator [Pantoea piersonii]MBZ6409169.1 GntR family transcriptional regulator [Pantoea piersonii]MBZ6426163.1 GntR family transcriptional regulator [Pantoea piersonii]